MDLDKCVMTCIPSVQFSRSVMSDSLRPQNCSTPGLPVHQQFPEFTQTYVHRVGDVIQPSHPLSITNCRSSPKLMPIELVMPSSHLILCHPLLLLPPSPPSITVFSNESTLRMRWTEYWSFSFSIIPSS